MGYEDKIFCTKLQDLIGPDISDPKNRFWGSPSSTKKRVQNVDKKTSSKWRSFMDWPLSIDVLQVQPSPNPGFLAKLPAKPGLLWKWPMPLFSPEAGFGEKALHFHCWKNRHLCYGINHNETRHKIMKKMCYVIKTNAWHIRLVSLCFFKEKEIDVSVLSENSVTKTQSLCSLRLCGELLQ